METPYNLDFPYLISKYLKLSPLPQITEKNMMVRTEYNHHREDDTTNEVTVYMVFHFLCSCFLAADLDTSFKQEYSKHFNYVQKITKVLHNNELTSRLTDS